MVANHVCGCEPGQPCSCGRPRGRQANGEVASEGVRLGQLQALYVRGGTPTEDDITFLATVRRPQNTGDAGRLLQAFGEQGYVPGYTPRRSRGRFA